MSTQSARRQTRKIQDTLPKLGALPVAEVLSRSSNSRLAEVYKTEEFRNDWANDVRFHVARNFLHLRRYRKMSQAEVGKAMGTSQSAVARIESAQENITLDTIQRFVLALKGRLHISIPPREISLQPVRLWWEAVASAAESPWTVVRFAARTTAHTDQFIIGLERPREHTLPTASTLAPGAARLLAEGKTGV